MSIPSRIVNYIKASSQELKKVVWPSKKEVIQHTMLVIGISVGVAAFLGIVDYLLTILIEIVI